MDKTTGVFKYVTLLVMAIMLSINQGFSQTNIATGFSFNCPEDLGANHSLMNLFPNGDVENLLVNNIEMEYRDEVRFRSRIKTEADSWLSYWRLAEGAAISDQSYSGKHAVELSQGKNEVSATVFSDYYIVKDSHMPFGLPLVPDREITVSFWYKTSKLKGKDVFSIMIKLGTIADLGSRQISLDLPASGEWKYVSRKIRLNELLWGGEVTFSISGHAKKGGKVWVDEVFMGQQLNGINLVENHSFEQETNQGTLPPAWQLPQEDQWVSWVGAQYRQPVLVSDESVSGHYSLRADVVYADGSGVAQKIRLNQREVKPIVFELWSKLNNPISTLTYNGLSGDNYANVTIYVYHQDGTMQEVSPLFSLDVTDHDWDFRRFALLSQKPVKEVLLQITLLGSQQTTSLWVDEVRAYEPGSSPEALSARGVDIPPRSLLAGWKGDALTYGDDEVHALNDDKYLYLTIPLRQNNTETSVYLNPHTQSTFLNHFRYLYHVIRISSERQVYKGTTIEKQGYTLDGEFGPATKVGIEGREVAENVYSLKIPFSALEIKGASCEPFGFNVKWESPGTELFWSGINATNREMGRLLLAKKPGVRIKSIRYGRRYHDMPDQSQDFVTHPQLYAGTNHAEIELVNDGADCQVKVEAGIEGELLSGETIKMGCLETQMVTLEYQAGLGKLADFLVSLTVNGETQGMHPFPVEVPAAVDMAMDQEFYYPEEDSAFIEVHNRYMPVPKGGELQVEINNLRNDCILESMILPFEDKIIRIPIDIRKIGVNALPVQDHSVTVRYLDEDRRVLGEQTRFFGKINHTKRRELPPIEKVAVDETGRLIINDNFRFFPVMVSNHIMDWDEALDMGANTFKGQYYDYENADPYRDREMAWEKNAYTLILGPHESATLETFKLDPGSPDLMSHPGVLGNYGLQFYYWKLSEELIDYRKEMERVMGELKSPRLLIWGHHDSSFLYDRDMPEWPSNNRPPVGYCYVKIMGRPGLGWRNTPFQTRTEQVLNRGRFKLAEVNQYFSAHYDVVVPKHVVTTFSLRSDDWHGLRNESYLSVLYGANGLFHWVVGQHHQIQRLRGWFQEMNYMWPVFVADEMGNKISIQPFDCRIDVELKNYNGSYYLIAANRDQKSKEASIHIDGFEEMNVEKLFDLPGEMSVEGGHIHDEWKKYDVHVYKINNVKL